GQREHAAFGDATALTDGVRPVREQLRHLGGRLEMPLSVRQQEAPGLVERDAEPDGGEDVEQCAAIGGGMPDVVGGDHGQAARGGQVGQPAGEPFAVALEMAVDVDGEAVVEDPLEAIQMERGTGTREWSLLAAGQAEESRGVLLDLLPARERLALRPAGCCDGEEPAEVPVARTVLDQ